MIDYIAPTEKDFEIIEQWNYENPKGWFDFIKAKWWESDSGFTKDGKQYNLHTLGWSNNEAIIGSMKENEMLWNLTWWSSMRGGHYTFKIGW